MSANVRSRSRVDFLDLMRIFAFVSVLIGHKFFPQLLELANNQSVHITIRYIAEGLMPLCYGGAAGVVVFFFISGYIITHVLQKEFAAEFLVKRVFRIYPLYIFAVFSEILLGWAVYGNSPPPISVLIPRILLIGDFFDTPYSLAGVEWTLRIEVLFYVFMAALKKIGLINRPALLPPIFVICTIMLNKIGPIPSAGWSLGYLNLYGPFLFVGSIIYLCEHGFSDRKYGVAGVAWIFFSFLMLISEIQPNWKNSNYALFAMCIFLGAWWLRNSLSCGSIARLISELTYSVYLFHNWLWDYLGLLVERVGVAVVPSGVQIFFALLVVCYFAHVSIERLGITLGRKVISAYSGSWLASRKAIFSFFKVSAAR